MSFSRPLSLNTSSYTPEKYPPKYLLKDSKPENLKQDPFGLVPYRRRINETKDVVLEWDNRERRLRAWTWPLHNSITVPPLELTDHRNTHLFRNPSCLCAMDSPNPGAVTETNIFKCKSDTGRAKALKGKFIAACARRRCGYFVNLSSIWSNPTGNLPLKTFPRRTGAELPAPLIPFDPEDFEIPSSSPPDLASDYNESPSLRAASKRSAVDNTPSSAESSKRAGKRRRVEHVDTTTKIKAGSLVRRVSPPASEGGSLTYSLYTRLDEQGLSLKEFEALFVVCNRCNDWVGTPSALEDHLCTAPHPNDILDLTLGSDSD